MGYITNFNLTLVDGPREEYNALCRDLDERCGMNFAEEPWIEAKWYGFGEDMTELTRLHPDITVELTGEGEDRDDNWAVRYRNGEFEGISDPGATEFVVLARADERKRAISNTLSSARRELFRIISGTIEALGGNAQTVTLDGGTVIMLSQSVSENGIRKTSVQIRTEFEDAAFAPLDLKSIPLEDLAEIAEALAEKTE